MKTTYLNVRTNGTYRGTVAVRMPLVDIERVVNSLAVGENCCITPDRTKVYNSSMTPLYTNGEICIARNRRGAIDRDYQVVDPKTVKRQLMAGQKLASF